jgi:site-specific DNA-adenine methylase
VSASLRAPFPWFGGKSRAAHLVWEALGNVANYVEPFFGSGAVLLARPHPPRTETVNDASRFLANFWRALATDPDAVAHHCDWPVNETDLHARHRWLVARLPELAALLDADPEAHDAKVAGWWVWGACAWIGTGWCDESVAEVRFQLPHLGNAGQGLHRKLPHLGNAGRGGHRAPADLPIQLPHVGDGGRGVHRGHHEDLRAYLGALSARLRRVRVACGDWSRVCGDSVTWRHGVTGVFLDPPYAEGEQQYAAGGTGTTLSADVRAWALDAGKRRDMRVVLAGLEGEHDMPGWRCVPWKARGGYGSQRDDGTVNANRHRERLWLSPHCEGARQLSLLGGGE